MAYTITNGDPTLRIWALKYIWLVNPIFKRKNQPVSPAIFLHQGESPQVTTENGYQVLHLQSPRLEVLQRLSCEDVKP